MNADDAMPLSDVMAATLQRLVDVMGRGDSSVARIDGFFLVGPRVLRSAKALARRGFAQAHAEHADYYRITESGRRALATHRSEEHTSELQSLMRISYAVFCLKKKNKQ